MNLLMVGDLHGDYELLTNIIDKFSKTHRLVFVGDYLDSFEHSIDNQAKTFNMIIDGAREGKFDALIGNHELSYLWKKMRCPGFNENLYVKCQELFRMKLRFPDISPLKHYLYIKSWDLLITHSGLGDKIYNDKNVEDFLHINIQDLNSPLYNIGQARGGDHHCGGIFWCDYRDEFYPIKGLKQVFGHTPVDCIQSFQDNYAIDCLEYGTKEVLEFDGVRFKILSI